MLLYSSPQRACGRSASAEPRDAIRFRTGLSLVSPLRKENPGVYESYVDLESGTWTRLKVVATGTQARLYVNGAARLGHSGSSAYHTLAKTFGKGAPKKPLAGS